MEFDFDLYYFLKRLLASFLGREFKFDKIFAFICFPRNCVMINFDFFTILAFLILIFNKEFFKSYSNEVIFYIKIILLESRLLLLYSNYNCLQ